MNNLMISIKNFVFLFLSVSILSLSVFLIIDNFLVVEETETEYNTTIVDCNEWNYDQCIDSDSELFGADVKQKICFNQCVHYEVEE